MAEDLFHVEDVSGLAVFHSSFPMAESMECNLIYS